MDDFLRLIGMEPVDARVALEPSELLAHIAARVAFDALNGLIKRPFAVEIAEKFLVADSVQGVESLKLS